MSENELHDRLFELNTADYLGETRTLTLEFTDGDAFIIDLAKLACEFTGENEDQFFKHIFMLAIFSHIKGQIKRGMN